jgi:hypothetical protein
MLRIFTLSFVYAALAFGQKGAPDPVFKTIPFERWVGEGGDARIRWSVEVFPTHLNVHQRLSGTISVRIDGAEFVKRTGSNRMVVFLELRDGNGFVFQTHRALGQAEVKNPSTVSSVNFDQLLFIVPGDYQVSTAVYDSESKEHAAKKMKLHVPGIARDPLAGAWRDLPTVEFITASEPPDSWYLPDVTSRLNLPVNNETPVQVEVLVNESPTELAARRTGRTMKRNMGNLIPALKVLSQMQIKNGSMNVTLLDLERRKAGFHQDSVEKLDWPRLRAALLENDPNSIDVHALEKHEQNAQFFVAEVRKRLESTEQNGDVPLGLTADPKKVLIVLSGPMAFPRGQDLTPIEAAPEPGSRVFYIRYFSPMRLAFDGGPPGGSQMDGLHPRYRLPPGPPPPSRGPATEDSLARTLKPLAPKTFDVMTPMEFRAALAAIMNEISRIK